MSARRTFDALAMALQGLGRVDFDTSLLQPVPEDATVIGTVPDILKSLWSLLTEVNRESLALCSEGQAKEDNTMMKEAVRLNRMATRISEIFWDDLHYVLSDVAVAAIEGMVGIGEDWKIWTRKVEEQQMCDNPECLACTARSLSFQGGLRPSRVFVINIV